METKNKEKPRELESKKLQQHRSQPASSSASSTTLSSSPSSHEFTLFSISLDPTANKVTADGDKSHHRPSDHFSPSITNEEIFSHGKLLLPLHHPTSPSSDTFTQLPIKDRHHQACSFEEERHNKWITKGKSKSFSLLGSRRKGPPQDKDNIDATHDPRQKRKSSKFDIVKQYLRPFVSLRKIAGEGKIVDDHPRPCSLSEILLQAKSKLQLRGKTNGGELFSAPSSMRSSPTNSGRLLFASATISTNTSTSMQELQAASIQDAIAHCKKQVHRL